VERVRRLRLPALAGLSSLLFAAASPAAEPARPGDPSARVLAEVVLPDLRATLVHAEATLASVAPGTLPPGTLQAMLGAQLKDPGLAALGAGPVVALVLAPESASSAPGVVLYLPVKNAQAYQDATAALGLASSSAKGLVIAASDAPTLASGRALEARYRAIGAARGSGPAPDLRFRLFAPQVMEKYGPLLRLGASAMVDKMRETPAAAAGKAPPAVLFALMRLEVLGALAALEQLAEARVDLSLLPDVVASETVLVSRPGTALAELAQAPPPGPNRAASLLEGGGSLAGSYRFDGARLSAFMLGLIGSVPDDPALAAVLTPEVLEVLRESGSVYTGEGAMRMDFRPGKGEVPEMVMQAVAVVTDEARALALVERSFALLAPMLEGLAGPAEQVQVTLKKDVRRTGGVAVHSVRVAPRSPAAKVTAAKSKTKKAPATPPATPFPFDAFDMQFAFTHGYYLAARDAAALDRLVARAGGPAEGASPLRAEKAFGPGHQGYMDYDILALLKSMPAPAGQPNPFGALAEGQSEPFLYAFSMEGGTMRFAQRMPLKPFASLVAAGKKAGAEKAEKVPQP